MQYPAKVSREGRFVLADFPDCPGCQTFVEEGESIEEAAQEALTGWLESNLGRDLVPPHPSAGDATSMMVTVPASLAVRLEIRWAREKKQLTQADLARALKMSQQQIAKLESAKANPTVDTLERLAIGLGMRVVFKLEPDNPMRAAKFLKPVAAVSSPRSGQYSYQGARMAGKKQDVHTVPKGGHWENKVGGKSTGVEHRSQAAAAKAGRQIAIQKHSEHSIHRRDGTIGAKNSYGNDPRKTKG
jgi:transcriptional regulator with XRE-family HTH domain/predicted RNase H-like HicB family nuclease